MCSGRPRIGIIEIPDFSEYVRDQREQNRQTVGRPVCASGPNGRPVRIGTVRTVVRNAPELRAILVNVDPLPGIDCSLASGWAVLGVTRTRGRSGQVIETISVAEDDRNVLQMHRIAANGGVGEPWTVHEIGRVR